MENLEKSMRNLSADQRAALLELARKNKDKAKKQQLNICRRKDETNCFPLSFSQNRLWFIDQLHTESIMYNFPFAYRIKGSLDINLLEKSLNEIIKRHEVLRTVFQVIDEEPAQVVVPKLNVKIEKDDLSGLPQRDKEQQALEIARKHAALNFNLHENPLIRFKLITLSENEVIFITTVHHIVFDSWSMSVFLKELSSIYNGYCNGEALSLPELTIQYADYAEALLRWFQGEVEERQLDYWKKKLGDELSVVEFPADKQRPKVLTSNGDLVNFQLSPEVTKKLRQLALAHQSTLNMVFLAAFKYLIYRYTHQSKVLIGSLAANRKMLETEELIGLFVNTLVLCTDINENMTFAELLQEVKKTVFGAFENQDMPFERLVEAYQLERDTSRSALVQIMFNYMNVPKSDLTLQGTKIIEYHLGGRTSIVEILLNMEEDEHIIHGYIEYNRDLYYRDTIERIVEQYKEVLNQILFNANKPIKEISIFSENEKHLILHHFNNTYGEYPREKTVAQLFEEQVERTPNHIAVVYENQQLTYKELNEKANALAVKLRKLGVGPDDFVVIIADRSIEMVAGIYSIIKAGGAYVPIDPSYPEDRVAYMIEDCKPKAILTYNVDIGSEVPVIDLGRKEVWEGPTGNLCHVNKPGDLVYIIYTSGTTGKPKGVMIENSCVINYCANNQNGIMREVFDSKYTKILCVSNMTFDIFVTEVILALLNGMTSYVANKDEQETALGLSKLQDKYEIEILQTTPSRIKIWISDDENLRGFEKLKYIMLGGEKVEASLVRELKKYTSAQIVNVYGPSETTVWCTRKLVELEETPYDIPIGKPINNFQIYILNGLNLCGIGIPGELCIAGDGLARGYLNRPDLTAEKFIQNPYGEGRIYRTGDLARWLSDGNIEYLGRMDEQVKIRGFRIELGEIESVLRKIDYVNDTAVIVREDKSGEKAIYAYIVSEQKISVTDIRDTIKKDLPEYMVPSYMMQIEKIPVTSNGKLDRRALPDIEAKSEKKYIAPRNKEETIICNIFSEILGLEQVGIKDNFFELGGHSLRATRVINRIESETGVRIPLKTIFKDATAEGLAKHIQNTSTAEYIPIPKAEKKDNYPMSSTQKRLFLINEIDDTGVAYNIPQALEIYYEINKEKLVDAIQKLLDRHEILRTSFHMENDEPIQRIREKIEAEIEEIGMRAKSIEEQKLILSQFVRPFNLCEAPLMRIGLAKTEESSILLFDMHHIISDGMSIGIFINELNALYNGQELKLPALQYKDYSEWMRARNISAQKEYWITEFNEEAPVIDLPYDYKRPQTQSFKGSGIEATLSKEIKEKIRVVCTQKGTTEYMVLLAGFMVMLGKYSRQEDIVVGSPISGRTHKDTENMLGMFVNTLAMRGRPQANKTFNDFLKEIKESCLKAYENQEYPFEELVETIKVNRELSRNPLFDVMFILQNNEKAEINFEMHKGKYVSLGDHTVAKLDLTVNITENENGYALWIEYCTDLFKQESIERMFHHFPRILEEIFENPNKKIGDIETVTGEEKKQIIEFFNNTCAEYPKEKIVAQLFEEQVERTPNHIAVVYENQQLTYKELNEKANALAVKLRELGVGPDDFVAIIAERSIEMVAGIYGVIKAGGAYVPIDPNYPEDRVAYMLHDCKPKAILTYKVDIDTEIPVIDLREKEVWEGPTCNPHHVNKPHDLLYIIYTSGSTGKPKGVMIENSCVTNYSTNTQHGIMKEAFDNGYTKILSVTNMTFDIFVTEVILALLNGMTSYIANKDEQETALGFNKLQDKHEIEILQTTPSRIKIWLSDDENLSGFEKLKYIMLGGEKVEASLVRELKKYTSAQIVNVYGPSETTVWSTRKLVEIEETPYDIPIGKPISNTKIIILNGSNLCGIGIPGELCIAGDGLARGYLNRPDLTAEKFIQNPYGEGKLYRTGDLARWLPDGNIEYLGRMDEQVKIRGFRIELGEIESVLRKIDYVNDTAVIVREDKSGEKAIYAYIVSEQKISVSDIRDTIKKDLPEYMVPSYMMQIEKIPVTSNGKLDRRALPDIEAKSEKKYIAPRNQEEAIICNIFSEILGLEQVGIKDNFFELGGHSLRATRVINRIQSETGIRITLKTIFKDATAEGLAKVVQNASAEEYIPIPKAEKKEVYPISSVLKRIYFLSQLEGGNISHNLPRALEVEGEINKEKLTCAIQKLLERHEILRTSFHMENGETIQRIHSKAETEIEEMNINGTDVEERNLRLKEFVRPFDLSQAPLVRVGIAKTEESTILLIDMHHIISDGMSMGIFIHELNELYNSEELKPLSIQYKDCSEWMRTRDISAQKQYWENEFRERAPEMNLQYDYKRPRIKSIKGSGMDAVFSKEIKEKVRAICSKFGATEYMVLMTGFMIMLNKYSGQEDVVVGSPISGRTHQDMENMLGMFSNILTMRGRPKSEKTFLHFLKEIKETSLKAYENQDYPFDELIGLLMMKESQESPLDKPEVTIQAKIEMARNPLIDVMFILQNNEKAEINFSGNKARYVSIGEHTSSLLDIILHITDEEEGYRIWVEYCTDLFKQESIRSMMEYIGKIIEEVYENPNIKISEIGTVKVNLDI